MHMAFQTLDDRVRALEKDRARATDDNYTDACLRRPDGDFWPWDEYVETFGDPTEPQNRKKGHTASVLEGVKGVAVPSEDRYLPRI